MSSRDRALAVFVAVLWGANFLVIDVALDHFPPIFLAGLRMLVVAVPTVLLVARPAVPLRWLIGYGLGFGTLQFLFLFLGLRAGMPVGLSSLVLQACGPFTLILGAVLLRERVAPRQWVGIGIAVAGLATIAVVRAQAAALLPVVLVLLGALGWAAGNLSSRLALRGGQASDAFPLSLWMTVIGPIPLLAASAVVEGPVTGWAAVAQVVTPAGWPGLAALIYLALVATVLGSGIWTALLQRNPAGIVAPHSLLVPVVGMTLAALLLGERLSVLELAAGAAVVAGVLVAATAPASRPAATAALSR